MRRYRQIFGQTLSFAFCDWKTLALPFLYSNKIDEKGPYRALFSVRAKEIEFEERSGYLQTPRNLFLYQFAVYRLDTDSIPTSQYLAIASAFE